MSIGRWSIAATAVVMLSLALASFFTARELLGDAAVSADEPELEAWWHKPILDTDDALERFDGTLNGIRMAPELDVRDAPTACAGEVEWFELDHPIAAQLNVIPASLPSGAKLHGGIVAACNRVAMAAEAEWYVSPDESTGFRGGNIQVYRFRGEPLFRGDYPTSRVQAVTFAGLPGIEVVPVRTDGLGPSAIILREEWGLTTVRAIGLANADLRAIALSLYEKGGRE